MDGARLQVLSCARQVGPPEAALQFDRRVALLAGQTPSQPSLECNGLLLGAPELELECSCEP